jgi:hypothetical protein
VRLHLVIVAGVGRQESALGADSFRNWRLNPFSQANVSRFEHDNVVIKKENKKLPIITVQMTGVNQSVQEQDQWAD